jgi:hypothetical protein
MDEAAEALPTLPFSIKVRQQHYSGKADNLVPASLKEWFTIT